MIQKRNQKMIQNQNKHIFMNILKHQEFNFLTGHHGGHGKKLHVAQKQLTVVIQTQHV